MTREESLKLASYKETPYYFQRLINKIYDSFEKDCTQCKHYLSENGNFPLEPCSECSLFYSNKWESKE